MSCFTFAANLPLSHCRFPRVLRLRFELPFSWRVGARELSFVGGLLLVFTRPRHGGDQRKVNRKLTWKGIKARGFSGLFRNPHIYSWFWWTRGDSNPRPPCCAQWG